MSYDEFMAYDEAAQAIARRHAEEVRRNPELVIYKLECQVRTLQDQLWKEQGLRRKAEGNMALWRSAAHRRQSKSFLAWLFSVEPNGEKP